MRRVIGCLVLVALLLTAGIPAAFAGTSTDVALGLASFAVFNQIVGPLLRPAPVQPVYVHREVVVAPAPVVYAPPPPVVYAPPPRVVYAPPAPVYVPPAPVYTAPPPVITRTPTVVQYATGRYELQVRRGHYAWVWIPAYAAVPPPPPGHRF